MLQTSILSKAVSGPGSLSHLRARNCAGWGATSTAMAISTSGVWLALNESIWIWAIGQVPGYDLHRIPYTTQNEVNCLDWTRGGQATCGHRVPV